MDDEKLLSEQKEFYRCRAPEYDEWWQRRGRYARGPEAADQWEREIAEVATALERFTPVGKVLELAGGTGWWTQRLVRTAHHLTVVDASPEALELNRQRVGSARVRYIVADVFGWDPEAERGYDVVFFSFWLSHVPRSRLVGFWSLVDRCLDRNGRVFFVDNRRDPAAQIADPYVLAEADDVQRRRLNDGSEHRVVKVFYEPDQLGAELHALGFHAQVRATRSFIFGQASRLDSS